MDQQGKLQTVSPRRKAADSPASPPDSEVATTAPASPTPVVPTPISAPVANSDVPFSVVHNPEHGQSRFLKSILKRSPGVAISFLAHVILVTTLALIFTNPLIDQTLKIDGLIAKSNIEELEEISFESEPTETEDSESESVELASEATFENIDTTLDSEIEASLVEGTSLAKGFEGLADSGLSPLKAQTEGQGEGKGEGTGEPSFFGAEAKGSDFVFIIDASDSMNEGFRWQRALAELEKVLLKMTAKEKVLIVLYNHEIYPMFNVAPELAKTTPVTNDFRNLLLAWLKQQRPTGGTRPAKALEGSFQLQPDAIFLLSDGLLQDNSQEVIANLNAAGSQPVRYGGRKQIPIHTISLGPNLLGAQLMKQIADSNSGVFNWIK